MIKQVTYEYKKKDGTIRNIICNENTVSYFKPNGIQKKHRDNNHTHLILWDIEKQSWKTLIMKNIISEKSLEIDVNNPEISYVEDYESFHLKETYYWIYASIVLALIAYCIYISSIKIDF